MALDMLDVVIGMIFIYLLLSLICTAVNEFIEGFIKLRAVDLEQGLRELLNDPNGDGLVAKVYNHQLIYSLFRGDYKAGDIRNQNKDTDNKNKRYSRGSDLPSYIPSRNFALALMDVLLPTRPADTAAATTVVAPAQLTASGSASALGAVASLDGQATPNPLLPLRNAVALQPNEKVRTALLTIIDAAGGDAVKAREGIENWFNSAMDRVSGWYKRRVQQIVFVMGFVIAIVLNADSIALFRNLANDRPLRNAIVAQASNIKDTVINGTKTNTQKIQDNVNSLLGMGLPLGWGWKHHFNPIGVRNIAAIPESPFGWAVKVFGWLVTGLAISLGAPFWFDALNKIMVIRSTVKPTEKSPNEGSDARKT